MTAVNLQRSYPDTLKGGGLPVLSAVEEDIQELDACTLMFAPWLYPLESGGIRSFKNGTIAAPVETGILPSYNTIAGPNGHPEYRAQTGFPSGVLMTDAGMVGASFTMDVVFLANTSVFNANAVGIPGNGGGGFGIQIRAGNLARLVSYPNTTDSGLVIHASNAATTGLWHHVIARYDAATDQLKMWLNGAVVATVNSLVLAPATTRVAILGTHDLAGFTTGGARTGRMARSFVFDEAVSSDVTDALIATAQARFPVIAWA